MAHPTRAALTAMLALLLVAGCSAPPATPSRTATSTGPAAASAYRTITYAPDGTPTTGPTTTAPSPSSSSASMTLDLLTGNATVPVGKDVPFLLEASFRSGDGKPAQAPDAHWTARRQQGSGDAAVAQGDGLPARFTVRFAQAGPATVVGTVRAQGYGQQDVRLEVHVVASQAAATPPPASACVPPATPRLVPGTARPEQDLGPGDGEPNIVEAPDGTIYVTPVSELYRSTDGGATFTDLGTARTTGHGDGDTAIDAAGRLYWFGLDSAAVPFQSSVDQGDHFTPAQDLSKGGAFDREWIDARPDGTLYAAWRDNNAGLAFRASHDGGQDWGDIVSIHPDALAGPIQHGPLPGQVYQPLIDGSSVAVAASSDDGATWTTHRVAMLPGEVDGGILSNPTDIFPALAVDCAGTLYAAWSADSGHTLGGTSKRVETMQVSLSTSRDGGLTWSDPLVLSDPSTSAIMPWIAAGAPGRIAVTWYQSVLGVPSETLPDEWNVELWESITADQAAPQGALIQLNGAPNHIGSVCTAGLLCAAGGDRSLLDYFEVTLGNDGQPIVAWSKSVAGTGVGVAAEGTDVVFGGLTGGTPLK